MTLSQEALWSRNCLARCLSHAQKLQPVALDAMDIADVSYRILLT